MKKILLYNPQGDLIYWKKGNPPLPLLAISAILDKEGYDIKIFDYRQMEMALENIKGAICIGITCMTGYQICDGLAFARIAKGRYPDIPIVWGGRHPTLLPDDTVQNEFVDIVVRGQGELTFAELIRTIENSGDLSKVLGITYKDSGKVISNPDRPFEDVNNFPPLPYNLLDIEKHIARTRLGKRTIGYITSMGCPFHCGFCAEQSVFGRRWSALTAQRVIEDMRNLVKKYSVDSIILSDSNFFVSEKRVKDICEGIRDLHISWGQVNGRADTLVKYALSTWRIMQESGLQYILAGAESGLDECLEIIQKEATVNDTFEFTRIAKNYGVRIQFSLFIGAPGLEKKYSIEDELKSTLELIYQLHKINKDSEFLLFVYAPYPGTPLYEAAKQLGFKEPSKFEEWGHFDLNERHIPWVPDKYARLTWDLTYYLFFISGSLHRTIGNYPFPVKVFLLSALTPLYLLVLLRFKYRFFLFSFDVFSIKLFLKIKNRYQNIYNSKKRILVE